ncbi:MAG: hypothetical protein NTV19_08365 [Burkholderiales bacterium]|nr:hypothetical protein [Burkholderiales bacterium]
MIAISIAEVVGAQRMPGGGPHQPGLEVDLVDADLVDDRTEQHRQHQQAEHPQAPVGQPVAAKAAPRLDPGRDAGHRLAEFSDS